MEQANPQNMTPEEVEELKEKIKNMSPEELKEFQKNQCIFCQVISGKVQAKKIFEDEKTIAILDINPANPGHVLLFPKEHYTVMPQVPESEIAHIFVVAKSLSNTVLRSLEARGTNIIVANGPAAGQKAQHFMVHIIPRKENDNIKFDLPQKQVSDEELEAVMKKIVGKLSNRGVTSQPKDKKVDVAEVLAKKKPAGVEAEFEEGIGEGGVEDVPEVVEEEDNDLDEVSEIIDEGSKEIEKEEDKESKKAGKKKIKKKKAKEKKVEKGEGGEKEEGVSLDDISDLFG
jgi:histidine triad (HIT) family protein